MIAELLRRDGWGREKNGRKKSPAEAELSESWPGRHAAGPQRSALGAAGTDDVDFHAARPSADLLSATGWLSPLPSV
jgi:hypothetical protein